MAAAKVDCTDVEVVVIGAGISGLSAAHKILKNRSQSKVVVLEAKGRVGGRLARVMLKTANGTDMWDIGGQWVGGCQEDILKLMADLNVEHYPQWYTGSKVLELSDGHVFKYNSSFPNISYLALLELYWMNSKLESLCKMVPLDDPRKCPRAKEWDGMTVETWKQQNIWTAGGKELFDAAVGVMFGVIPAQMSMLFFLQNLHGGGGWLKMVESGLDGGAQEWRIKGTAYSITELLAEKIGTANVLLDHAVTAIKQEDDKVFVSTLAGKTFTAKRVILAIPPTESAKIIFSPRLPCKKLLLLQHMPSSHLIKFIATYSTAFWRKAGLSGESCRSPVPGICDGSPAFVTFDGTTHKDSPAIVGFLASYSAAQWSDKTELEVRRAILTVLEKYFGSEAAEPLDFAVKDWAQEKWCGGCPSNFMVPGAITNYGDCLKDKFLRVHWAGTESSSLCRGYMSGAVHAGWRAAQEVLDELQK